MASRVKAGYCRVKMKMASRIFSLFMLIFYLSNDSFVIQSALLPSTFLVAHICNSEDPVFKKFSIEGYYIHGLIIYFSEPPNGQYSLYTYKRFKKKKCSQNKPHKSEVSDTARICNIWPQCNSSTAHAATAVQPAELTVNNKHKTYHLICFVFVKILFQKLHLNDLEL